MSDWAIETEGLTKQFGKHLAVDDLNLQVPLGTVYGLIGPNGAGKTTTLRMLAGLLMPTRGRIHLKRIDVTANHRPGMLYRMVGYMPDFFGVYEDMRTWEYLDFFGRCYRIPPERRAQLVTELLELVDLSGKRDADVNSLSRGMKQRLCLAHALVHDPAILLLDEPASGLDPRARLEMRELLLELRAMGKTIVISSHILPELAEMCDAVGIMERGRLLAGGTVSDLERAFAAGQMVRIDVLSPVQEALAVLADMPGVTVLASSLPDTPDGEAVAGDGDGDGEAAVAVAPEAGADGGWIEVQLAGDDRARAELVGRLAGAGVLVSAAVPRTGDLEQLFIHVTKGEVA
jgi:ABC-2 type transport system ATP-binding protein